MTTQHPLRADKINNPILPGFNPDPSICRVNDDYYIATSTFEWYPGVQIHHSKDLVNWTLIARPLNREDLLNMLGNPDSCGVWAPCLTYEQGKFYLVFTDVKRFDGVFKDTHNYITTCDSIDGEWSTPVHVNSSGFDPSLFHDDDGRKWFLNMVWDHRPDRTFFQGIVLQEYCEQQECLIGQRHFIFAGSELGFTEGPHLYKKDGYYFLSVAEGGTGYNHAQTMARSKSITGPYEVDPLGHFISAKDSPNAYLQRTGHGDIVQTPSGDYYFVHLSSRPITDKKLSPMGRETSIQKLIYTQDKWFRLAQQNPEAGAKVGQAYIDLPDGSVNELKHQCHFEDFNETELAIDFQWLRTPYPDDFMSLSERPGYLRLKGRESVGSPFTQALIARRQQAFTFQATTKVEFTPTDFQHQAGLINYYNASKFHYLFISYDEEKGKYLSIMSCEGDLSLTAKFPLWDALIALPDNTPVYLRANVDYHKLVYSYSIDGQHFVPLPIELDAAILSDEAGKGEGANFTGAFVGVCCQDLTGMQNHADFDFFDYQESLPE
ncbi:glycoside hydrolase family 43 protein [Thalassotalea aquiviva]|uniref:glycoside hydrolase family 43 protein n=1 Tax=Thalassotalea aquiviva TaxID=3242415 RepID=UPI00352AAC8C